MNDRVRRYRILAFSTGERDLAYPAFQFDDRAALPVVDTSRLGDDVIRTVERRCGIRIVPAP